MTQSPRSSHSHKNVFIAQAVQVGEWFIYIYFFFWGRFKLPKGKKNTWQFFVPSVGWSYKWPFRRRIVTSNYGIARLLWITWYIYCISKTWIEGVLGGIPLLNRQLGWLLGFFWLRHTVSKVLVFVSGCWVQGRDICWDVLQYCNCTMLSVQEREPKKNVKPQKKTIRTMFNSLQKIGFACMDQGTYMQRLPS